MCTCCSKGSRSPWDKCRRPVISETRKASTASSASSSKSLKSWVRACLMQPSWTWSQPNRLLCGLPHLMLNEKIAFQVGHRGRSDCHLEGNIPEFMNYTTHSSRWNSLWALMTAPQGSWTILRKLSPQGNVVRQCVFVMNGLRTNLLGLPAISALGLAVRVNTTETYIPITIIQIPTDIVEQ